MPTIDFDQQAETDLEEIHDFIGVQRQSPRAAEQFVRELHGKLAQYSRQPDMDEPRSELLPGLRSFTFKSSYVVIYRPLDDGIQVLRVLHGARDYQQFFGPK